LGISEKFGRNFPRREFFISLFALKFPAGEEKKQKQKSTVRFFDHQGVEEKISTVLHKFASLLLKLQTIP
jgi:hypothetical protein